MIKQPKKLGLVGKVILGTGAVVSLFSENAKANTLSMALSSNAFGVQKSSAELTHHSMPEQFNYSFIFGNNSAIDIFYLNGTTEMKGIGKFVDSMETETAYIRGRGLGTSVNAQLSVDILTASIDGEYPENNFLNKNIWADLYNTSTGTLQGTYNVKDYATNGWTVPVTISNGLSYTMNVRFEPAKAGDFNVDGNVDILDLGILAENWLRNDCSSLNNYCNFSDMNKDTEVNLADFAQFANQWLE